MASRGILTLSWAASRAAISLALSAAAWMLSALTPSPLVNGLLPAVTVLPLLWGLPARPRLGTALQLLAALGLLAIAARLVPVPVVGLLVAVLLLTAGAQLADLPLQRQIIAVGGVPMAALRTGSEAGRLMGTTLAALLFPIGKTLLQFSQALVLLLPLTLLSAWLQPRAAPCSARHAFPGWDRGPLLQGALFGALFGLLPLWVRQQSAGNCVDFAMVLTAYGLGRAVAEVLQGRIRFDLGPLYLALAGLLAGTQLLSGWAAVLLFVPLGLLAAASDLILTLQLASDQDRNQDLAMCTQRFNRSACLGAVIGGLGMGAAAQLLSLFSVLPILLLAFVAMAAWMPRLVAPTR